MGIEYIRPKSVDEIRKKISSGDKLIFPLYGTIDQSILSRDDVVLVDLQDVRLNAIEQKGAFTVIGGMVTVQQLVDFFADQADISDLLKKEFSQNQRNMVSVADTLIHGGGRSSLLTMLLAYDVQIEIIERGDLSITLGDYLITRQSSAPIISHIRMSTESAAFGFEAIRRSPADLPLVCAAAVKWKSGRVRLCLGGYGTAPIMAFDGKGTAGMEKAARDAYSQAGDAWATSEYRETMADVLASRLAGKIQGVL